MVAGNRKPSLQESASVTVLHDGAAFTWTNLGSAQAGTLDWSAWPSAAPGQDWCLRCAVADAAAVHGVSLSDALRAVEP